MSKKKKKGMQRRNSNLGLCEMQKNYSPCYYSSG
jgi:hypothetical protein